MSTGQRSPRSDSVAFYNYICIYEYSAVVLLHLKLIDQRETLIHGNETN